MLNPHGHTLNGSLPLPGFIGMSANDKESLRVATGGFQHMVKPVEHIIEKDVRLRLACIEDHIGKYRDHLFKMSQAFE